jgi:hypothetical protein
VDELIDRAPIAIVREADEPFPLHRSAMLSKRKDDEN